MDSHTVHSIRLRRSKGETLKRVSDAFGISVGSVWNLTRDIPKHRRTSAWVMNLDLYERFMWNVKINVVTGCWEWQASRSNLGYGRFAHAKRFDTKLAHRIAYLMIRGEIENGLHLDHLCRVPWCVNPWHLEPVTQAENIRRGVVARREIANALQEIQARKRAEFIAYRNSVDTEAARRMTSL